MSETNQENVKTPGSSNELDLGSLMKNTNETEKQVETVESKEEAVATAPERDESMDLKSLMTSEKKESVSPIDELMNSQQKGVIVTNEEVEEAKKKEEKEKRKWK